MKDQFSKLPSSLGGTDSENTKFYKKIGLSGDELKKVKNKIRLFSND